MRFKLSKSKFLIVLLFLASIVVSCKKEENDASSAYIISGKIEKVYQTTSMNADEIRVYGEKDYLLATCPISSGGQFRVALSIPPSDYLDSVNEGIPPAGLNLSNEKSKGVNIDLIAYKKGQKVGKIEKLKAEENVVYRNQFIYVDSDNILTGKYSFVEDGIEYEYIYNENLREGWNSTLMIIYNDKDNNKVTVRHEKGKEPKGMEWIIW